MTVNWAAANQVNQVLSEVKNSGSHYSPLEHMGLDITDTAL
jgi:hypothetical protein